MLKLLYVGGCHVEGWLVGGERSFVNVASNKLHKHGLVHTYEIISGYLMKHRHLSKIVDVYEPDILVLQVGHYEFTPNFKKTIKKKLGINALSRNKANPMIKPIISADYFYKKSFLVKFKDKLKNGFVKILRDSFFDINSWNEQAEQFFSFLMLLKLKRIVVLGLFPCADSSSMMFRAYGNEILQGLAEKYNCEFLNINESLGGENDIFADPIHLNVKGHKLLGENLAQYLLENNRP